GDFNVPFDTGHSEASELVYLLETYGFTLLIKAATRERACIDNIFANFNHDSFVSELVDFGISDHLGQLEHNIDNKSLIRNLFRPIIQEGFIKLYNDIEIVNWIFEDSIDMNIKERFEMFFCVLEQALLKSFPEKNYLERSSKPKKNPWFDESLRLMREQLKLLSEVSKQYNRAEDLENNRRFTIQYKQAIKNAKKVANDNAINTARNPTKCMRNIINQKKGTEENCLLPQDFSKFFAQVADKPIDKIPRMTL
ncbi:hypothetical protein HHI36_014320, partial [Cryptolaemus montrouzieri]